MLKQIVSGDQTGVDRAAAEVAGEFGISYQPREVSAANTPVGTLQNVIDSDATLILNHGHLTGGLSYARDMAEEHQKICLHVDLVKTAAFAAVKAIAYWINRHNVRTLHVAGPTESEDPRIYADAKKILSSVLCMSILSEEMPDAGSAAPLMPTTVEEAMEDLITCRRLLDLTNMAKMDEEELHHLDASLGRYIRTRYGLWTGNKALLQSCRRMLEDEKATPEEASSLIIRELWNRLQKTHRLRAVK